MNWLKYLFVIVGSGYITGKYICPNISNSKKKSCSGIGSVKDRAYLRNKGYSNKEISAIIKRDLKACK